VEAPVTPIYSFEDVELVFRAHGRHIPVLSGFNATVMPGERVVLRGMSGAGKTTVLNLMAGFLSPTLGSVRFNGRDLGTLTGREMAVFRNGQIGIVHQFFNLIPSFSSLANAAAPLLVAGCGRKKAKERAMELLERVGVAGRAEHYPRELSGGEQQRVAIARAVIHRPSVILADEPTGNLDAASSAAVLEILAGLSDDHTTLIVATHEQDVAALGGRVVTVGAPEIAAVLDGYDSVVHARGSA
jgi:ABC-type lipoprotein export system ATPase subunit